MIPKIINHEHVLKAIQEIRQNGFPKKREATKFHLLHDGRLYPPKYVLSLAAKYATGSELSAEEFSGGNESNDYLSSLGYDIKPKNDDWSWKECYFAVWGYDQLDLDDSQIKAALYREIADLIGRSEKALEYKLQNVSSFDPRPREQKPLAEAQNAQALLGEVFKWYWADREKARSYYDQYREEFMFNLEVTTKVEAPKATAIPDAVIEEGASTRNTSMRRKRSQKLVEEGRKHFRSAEPDGLLRCHACGFVTPKLLDTEVIQLHHTEPIYESNEDGRTMELRDAINLLVPLCPTCHALAHTSRPPLSVAAIKQLVDV